MEVEMNLVLALQTLLRNNLNSNVECEIKKPLTLSASAVKTHLDGL